MSALMQFFYVQINGFKFIELVARLFTQVEILEQVGYFYKLRVPKKDNSIGFLFSLI